MGANATTKVPSYAAGQVLTAADLSITNSGIPVFANSTDRTNSFGGTGEKTLAEGQYAYLEDDNKTYYYDGAAWKEVGASGLVVVKAETAFTSATSVTADNVFTSTYTNYLIVVRCTTTSNATLFWALRVGGVTAATNYNYQSLTVSSTTVAGARSTSQTKCGYGASGTTMSLNAFILSGPNLAEATTSITQLNSCGNSGGITVDSFAGIHTTATAYDGIELTGGTATGSYTIYGMAKS